jgi:hypothetical protein
MLGNQPQSERVDNDGFLANMPLKFLEKQHK